MRLGQLARKLALSPSEIIDYLASQQLSVAEGANTRLDENQVSVVLQRFAPAGLKEDIPKIEEPKVERLPAAVVPLPEKEPVVESQTEIVAEAVNEQVEEPTSETKEENGVSSEKTEDANSDKIEVIKAPKVALSGLKVLGKIELRDPKKKEVEKPAENVAETVAENPEVTTTQEQPEKPIESKPRPRRENRRPDQYRNDRRDDRPRKNPVALAREREAQAAEEKRREEEQRKKEQRTLNYQKRIKTAAPTKAARLIKEEVEYISNEDVRPAPKTWIGKFWRWFRS